MNAFYVPIIIALIDAIGKYGAPAVSSAITALNKDEITEADILNLKITKEPEEF